ncbi:olfactory receptor 49-like [Cynoglossus semilaevis]|uniref:olfactory receptor 49-like n=1 Tax=Cynoglossus semilaevis TaxID=244447 RepID=UPI0004955204|nr:olfactory receptor 49-like [Cynoglossus semilaevis]
MSVNSTQVSYFIFSFYSDIGLLKYLVFFFLMCLYVIALFVNLLLIVVICMNRSLHEPMYLFLCSLFVNELWGSTGLFPLLLLQILSDVHTIPVHYCYLQIFCLYIYANVDFYNLAVLSYDRYLAICCPLQYSTRMSSKKVAQLIAMTWLIPLVVVMIMVSLNASLKMCGNVIDRLYCDNYTVVKLACSDTTVNNVYGLIYTFIVLVGLVCLIAYTYFKILRVCLSGSKQCRQKAMSTCIPHLASLFNFFSGCFLEVIQSRLSMKGAPILLRIFMSLYFTVSPPIFNPLVYGLNLSKIRVICKSLFSCQR